MRLRNLFLATVACAGLFTACSNEMDNVIDNVDDVTRTTKDAFVQIGFALPASGASTRANDDEAGTTAEREITSVTLVIADDAGKVTDFVELNGTDFSPEAVGGQPGASNKYYYTSKSPIAVTKSETPVQIFVYLNPIASIKTLYAVGNNLTDDEIFTGTENLTAGGVATANNFFMTNERGEAVKQAITGTKAAPTAVKVNVERAVAKLLEGTSSAAFTVINNGGYDKELKIAFTDFAYFNLNKTSFVLPHFEAAYTKDTNFGEATYIDPFFCPNTANDFTAYTVKGTIGSPNTTYCLENTETAENQWTNKTTGVIYKAVATWDAAAANTFYIYLHKVFVSWDDLKAEYDKVGSDLLNATDNYTFDVLKEKDIVRYTDGICYYRAVIKHDAKTSGELQPMEFAVVRNNLYKLNIRSVSGLGEPFVPTTPEPDRKDEANLNLEVNVLPWTVRDSNFDL